MKTPGAQAKEILYGLEMFVVLTQRIEELVAMSVDGLGPLSRSFISEDPASEVLRFDHEHPEPGHNYVVYLRRAVACEQGQVVERTVRTPIEA
jgi:hypothetical protein